MKTQRLRILFVAVALLLAACGSEAPSGDPSAFADRIATATAPLAAAAVPLSQIIQSRLIPGQSPADASIEIRAGEIAYIDASADVGELIINGELHCLLPNENPPANVELKARVIHVNNLFRCGLAADGSRFNKKLTISLKRQPDGFPVKTNPAYRALLVMGTLELNGDPARAGIVRLIRTVSPGTIGLTVDPTVSPANWLPGDKVVVAPSSYNWAEGEELTVESVTTNFPRIVYTTTPTRFRHWGEPAETFTTPYGTSKQLDQRAEVANLTRNIVIRADESDGAIDETDAPGAELGAHVMVHGTGIAKIDAVEFDRVGQAGIMGRYPFHWHERGDGRGQYIKRSTIHRSFQRCIVVHKTDWTLIENNVCFDFKGHGFFFEAGTEHYNTMQGNLGISAKYPHPAKVLLASENPDPNVSGAQAFRFPAVSVYWISHPYNLIRNNIAAGSVGVGFWNAFANHVFAFDPITNNYVGPALSHPSSLKHLDFSSNTAHSARVGITWDGGPQMAIDAAGNPVPSYSAPAGQTRNPNNPADLKVGSVHYIPGDGVNPVVPVFSNLTAYKNLDCGIYFRGQTAVFTQAMLADNGWSLFFAYNQIVKDSVVVGRSLNHGATEDAFLYPSWFAKQAGVILYDGPFELDGVLFAKFPTAPIYKNNGAGVIADVTPVPFFTIGGSEKFVNITKKLSFSPQPYYRAFMDAPHLTGETIGQWTEEHVSNAIRDKDGTLTGTTNGLLIGNTFTSTSSCSAWANMPGFKVCPSSTVVSSLGFDTRLAANDRLRVKIPFVARRSDGTVTLEKESWNYFHGVADTSSSLWSRKVFLINPSSYDYDLLLKDTHLVSSPASLFQDFWISTISETPNQMSPATRIMNLGSNCTLTPEPNHAAPQRVFSYSALKSATTSSYYASGNEFWVRLKANQPRGLVVNDLSGWATATPYVSDAFKASCSAAPIPTVMGFIDGTQVVNGHLQIRGWACDYGKPNRIGIHMYVQKPNGSLTYTGGSVAEAGSEAAVNIACADPFIYGHRFVWEIPDSVVNANWGRKIYIFGISTAGGNNNALANSGVYTMIK